VRDLAEIGYREVTLLGQTVNSYRYDDTDFADLLRRVAAVDGIHRVRFTSPHPAEFTEKVIAAMAETPEVCPYVHLPVQSGDDEMLHRMRRDYTMDEYRTIVANLRSAIPDVALSTDVIVGFCGETEEQFERTYQLMDEMQYDFAFMFKYSAREGTLAARSLPDDVSEEDKGRRLRAIIDQQEAISERVFASHVGNVVDVLIEGPAKKTDGHSYGRAADFKAVVVRGEFPRNTFVRTQILRSTAHTLFGDPI
jgi:tRNA-2-methylthio-N6-dimethylallyladenosine synthase